jgi:predicted RNA-binding protein with PIN domain
LDLAREPASVRPVASAQTYLLVDGANVLHAWPETRALLRRDRAAARARLTHAAAAIHDAEGTRVTLVFDGSGATLSTEQPGAAVTFAIVTTPSGTTADDVIEQLVGVARAPENCVVATGDQGVRQTVTALGATWMPPDELAAWAERAERRLHARVAGLRRETDKKWRHR